MKTILITGASRGIGAAAARVFASRGWHPVITCSQDKDSLFALKTELEQTCSVPCDAFVCDMGRYEEVEKLFSRIPAPDALINNAGRSYFGLLSEMSPSDWQQIMDTNLNACFYTCRLAIPAMVRRQAGRILNISSVWGQVGASMETAYSASKGAVNAFTRALAKELAPSNIQVNAVACGVINTVMNAQLDAAERKALEYDIPMGRFGTPEEAAQLIFDIANAPSYMTGQIIGIDGGYL